MSSTPNRESLYKAWLEDHRGIFVKVTRSFAKSESDATELRHELMLQTWMSLPLFAGQAKPSTWIYRVCLNTALTWQRGFERRWRQIEPVDISQISVSSASPAESADQKDILDRLYAAIRAIPEFDRALVLLMLDGMAYREMAEVTGLSENQVGVALTRARKRLSILLKGVTDELE
jgi:RNA polymerase sigma-70 factor (ECF subfamily)